MADQFSENQQQELAWGSHMLLTATPAASVLVFWRHQVVLRRGLISQEAFEPGAITQRAMEREQTIPWSTQRSFRAERNSTPCCRHSPPSLFAHGKGGAVIVGGGRPVVHPLR